MRIGSYPSVFAIGHKAIAGIFDGPCQIEEKVDGSQFSMMVQDGELICRSKGKQLVLDAPEKMFSRAIETAQELRHTMVPGWVYRCEYLQKPKHNTLCYGRTPEKYLILFDVMTGLEEYLPWAEKSLEADRIGLECVPLLKAGKIDSLSDIEGLLENDSCLGGCKIEGFVVKNYSLFTPEKKVAVGKFVSERFKEKHQKAWRKDNPTQGDILQALIESYKTEARWEKAAQHLREHGVLEDSPRDIGKLIVEVKADTKKECEDEIKDRLFRHFWKHFERSIVGGLPEWYKKKLAGQAFE